MATKQDAFTQIFNPTSNATEKPQPTKMFDSGSNSIPWSDPNQPSINNATRREEYAIKTSGSTTSNNSNSTNIWMYQTTTTPVMSNNTTNNTQSIINDKWSFSYWVQGWDTALSTVKDFLAKSGIDATKEVYWNIVAQWIQNIVSSNYDLWALMQQQKWVIWDAPNIQKVIDLSEEVAMAMALWESDPSKIAKQLNQEDRVISKIMSGKANELVELDKQYADKQLKSYIRAGEDYTTDIQRNIVQFQNQKQNLDYQFNSAMDTIERNLFDSERAAQTNSAILWMTWTKYTLDRLKIQYQQQMDDLQNTYDYQSATAQLSINNALEDYSKNMLRLSEDYDEAYKALQQNVLSTMQNLNNQVWLTVKQQSDILTNLQTNIATMKATALNNYLAWLEDWNTALSNAIANAYWMSVPVDTSWSVTKMMSTYTDWQSYNWQCWTLVNEYLWWKAFWSELKDKTKWIDTTEFGAAEVWDVLVMNSPTQPKYWHVAIVVWKNSDWSLQIMEATTSKDDPNYHINYRNYTPTNNWWTSFIWVAKATWKLASYFKWWTTATTTTSEWVSYNENDTPDYENFLQKWVKWFTDKARAEIASRYWSWDNFTAAATAYWKVASKESATNFVTSIKELKELETAWNNLSAAQKKSIWTIWTTDRWESVLIWWSNIWAWNISNVYALFNTVSAQWFIDTIISSKSQWASYWQLSDKEWASLRAAWSSLSLKDPNNFSTKIADMINNMASNLKELWYTQEEINSMIWWTTYMSYNSWLNTSNSRKTSWNNINLQSFTNNTTNLSWVTKPTINFIK